MKRKNEIFKKSVINGKYSYIYINGKFIITDKKNNCII